MNPMGVIINFNERRVPRQQVVSQVEPAWSKYNDPSEVDAFHDYVQSSESWLNDGYWETLYEGYPFLPPSKAPHPDAVWYVGGKEQHFGVWLLNKSGLPIEKVDGH